MNADTPLQLLGGLTAADCTRDYWQRKPLLVRQAIPDFESPLSADELAGLSLEESVESRIVLEHGKTPWEMRRGPFQEEDYQHLPEQDWTLLVQAVDQFVPEVAQLLEQFRFLPSWRIDDVMISYAAPGGGVEFRASTTTTYSCFRATDAGAGKSDRCAAATARCASTPTCASSPTSNRATSGSWSPATCSTCPRASPTTASPKTSA